ncbi:hypothetical protein GCM10023087_04170 [Microbacterium rhizosphaerae]
MRTSSWTRRGDCATGSWHPRYAHHRIAAGKLPAPCGVGHGGGPVNPGANRGTSSYVEGEGKSDMSIMEDPADRDMRKSDTTYGNQLGGAQ